jgi:hypothetical protein
MSVETSDQDLIIGEVAIKETGAPEHEPEPEPEPEPEKKGIPGFPYHAIILGLAIFIIFYEKVTNIRTFHIF